jgi:hypothetical protein
MCPFVLAARPRCLQHARSNPFAGQVANAAAEQVVTQVAANPERAANAFGAWGGGVGSTPAASAPPPSVLTNGGGDLAAREAALARREAELARREAQLAATGAVTDGVIKVCLLACCGSRHQRQCVCVCVFVWQQSSRGSGRLTPALLAVAGSVDQHRLVTCGVHAAT